MKMKQLLIILFIATSSFSKAQFVTIPDPIFAGALNAYYPSCMSGNQLDTTCTALDTVNFIMIAGSTMTDLTGLKYLRGLKEFNCNFNDSLTTLPAFPDSLQHFYCFGGKLTSLPPLPS